MKLGRGGDSQDALRAVWMEGYNRGRQDERRRVPFVKIHPADLARVNEPGTCAHPETCPCSAQPGVDFPDESDPGLPPGTEAQPASPAVTPEEPER